MNRFIFRCVVFAAMLACAASCSDGRGVNIEIPSVIYFTDAGLKTVPLDGNDVADRQIMLNLYKGGYNDGTVTVYVGLSEYVLDRWNEEHGTTYKLLEQQYWEILTPKVSLSGENWTGQVCIGLHTAEILSDLDLDDGYVLPVSITGLEHGEANADKCFVLLYLSME